MNRAIVSLGSNIDPQTNIAAALNKLARAFKIIAQSQIVETRPIDRPGQPNYLNGAVLVETNLDRDAVEAILFDIESQLGRVRTADKYASRTIDLDVVAWNDRVVDRDVFERDFLRNAVVEICPELDLTRTDADQ